MATSKGGGRDRSLRVVTPQGSRPTVQEASLADAEAMVENWSDEILSCRSGLLVHSWTAYTAVIDSRGGWMRTVVRCSSCTTLKFTEMSLSGRILTKPWYRYPPGYQSKGRGRLIGDAKDLVRAKSVERLFQVQRLSARQAKEDGPRPATLRALEGSDS